MSEVMFNVEVMGKPRMTRADAWKKRPVVLRYWRYKDELRRQAKQLKYIPGYELNVSFFIPCPKSWSKKKVAEMAGKPHQQKPDIDNILKGFMDCLLDEDKKVWNITANKYWMIGGQGIIIAR